MPPSKRSNWLVALKVQDPDTAVWVDMGKWAVLEGGGVTSDEALYHDWDGPQQLGGVRSREDATVRRLYGRHANEVYSQLDSWVGRARVELARAATGDTGATVGETIRYTGVLAGASLSDVEKGSSDGAELELVMQLDANLA
ncbi:hypothetical protein [Miltoncostaea marina]|uniref:hypothetical protein n=1 Tax=Miltoncostaea marina TaxID=2843215 RepID=UPI001C3D3B7E|nr:hypothetical protein [Miltoncostaea marina]